MRFSENDEWLEADGLGGFASGTATGIRTRRYHALLLTATTPPTGRMVLVNGFDASFTNASGSFALTSQRYEPGVIHPDGATRITAFSADPWPRWIFSLADGTTIAHEIIARHGSPVVAVSWRLLSGPPGTLSVRPFFSGRDYHSLHRENGAFRFEPESSQGCLVWQPYDGVPPIHVIANGEFESVVDRLARRLLPQLQPPADRCVDSIATVRPDAPYATGAAQHNAPHVVRAHGCSSPSDSSRRFLSRRHGCTMCTSGKRTLSPAS